MPKITSLPSATTPLTGNELIPLVQDGVNVKAGVGTAMVLESFGDLPSNAATGALINVPDAKGGKGPGYWDGDTWRRFGGNKEPLETEGVGIWFLGVGACPANSPVSNIPGTPSLNLSGRYFISYDGYTWYGPSNPPLMSVGIASSAYANGMWVVGGVNAGVGCVKSTTDPAGTTAGVIWGNLPPFGFVGGLTADAATAYDNDTGLFTVPVLSVGDITILNDTGAADPNDDTWPHQGVNGGRVDVSGDAVSFSSPCVGVGTQGPVEVRIGTLLANINRHSINEPPHFIDEGHWPSFPYASLVPGNRFDSSQWGDYLTDFIEVRKLGSPDWGPTISVFLNGGQAQSAGLTLFGLVWGVVKNAVEFAAGAD